MQPFPKNIDPNINSVTRALLEISRYREEDIIDRNTFPSIFMRGRKVGKVPSSPSDVSASDRVGDFNYDESNYYLCAPSGSTVIWKIQPFNGIGIYGEMYATNVSQTITVSAANAEYEIEGGFSQGTLSGFTFGGNHYLQATYSGVYLINWSLSIDTSGAGQELEAGIMINGSVQSPDKGTAHTTVAAGLEGSTVAASAILALSATNQVSLYVRNHSAATNIVMEHGSVVLTRIGNL